MAHWRTLYIFRNENNEKIFSILIDLNESHLFYMQKSFANKDLITVDQLLSRHLKSLITKFIGAGIYIQADLYPVPSK